jgi:hypothetical protein
LRCKRKEWLAWNQNNVSRVEWHVYPCTVVSVSYHCIYIYLSMLFCLVKMDIFSWIFNFIFSLYSWKINNLSLRNNSWLTRLHSPFKYSQTLLSNGPIILLQNIWVYQISRLS